MSLKGLGCAKTKSDLVVMPSEARIFAFFCSERDHKPQNSGCGYTMQSFHTAWVTGCRYDYVGIATGYASDSWSTVKNSQGVGRTRESSKIARYNLQGFAGIPANSLQITGGIGLFHEPADRRRSTARFWSVLGSIRYRSLDERQRTSAQSALRFFHGRLVPRHSDFDSLVERFG